MFKPDNRRTVLLIAAIVLTIIVALASITIIRYADLHPRPGQSSTDSTAIITAVTAFALVAINNFLSMLRNELASRQAEQSRDSIEKKVDNAALRAEMVEQKVDKGLAKIASHVPKQVGQEITKRLLVRPANPGDPLTGADSSVAGIYVTKEGLEEVVEEMLQKATAQIADKVAHDTADAVLTRLRQRRDQSHPNTRTEVSHESPAPHADVSAPVQPQVTQSGSEPSQHYMG